MALLLASLWILAAVVSLTIAARELQAGVATAENLESSLSLSAVLSGDSQAQLAETHRHFERAAMLTNSPVVSPLRVLPVAGRQLRSVAALSRAASEVVDVGRSVLREGERASQASVTDGPERLELVRSLRDEAGRASGRLQRVELGPADALVGPLHSRRATFAERLAQVQEASTRATDVLTAVHSLLDGDGRYLLLAANNSEMRAGSGMFLSAGVLSVSQGALSLDGMQPTEELFLREGVPMSGDFAARWGAFMPNQEWRNLALSPRFDQTGALAADMWQARTGERVDGVLAMDVIALQAVLRSVGSVTVEDDQIDADGVVAFVLHDQYVRFEQDRTQQVTARRDHLGQIASAVVTALETQGTDIPQLAEALTGAAAGRHLLAWSADPREQRGWQAAHVSGEMDASSLLVTVQNRGVNKLDWFFHLDCELRVSALGDRTLVEVLMTMENGTPPGEPSYVAGGPTGDADGLYRGLVTAYLPGSAQAINFQGRPLAVAGPDGPSQVASTAVSIEARTSQQLTLSFELPADFGALEIVPSARVPSVSWRFGDLLWQDESMQRIELN